MSWNPGKDYGFEVSPLIPAQTPPGRTGRTPGAARYAISGASHEIPQAVPSWKRKQLGLKLKIIL